jgi:uncharacterized membrane protein
MFKKIVTMLVLVCVVAATHSVAAQVRDEEVIAQAVVISVSESAESIEPLSSAVVHSQTLSAKVTEGAYDGRVFSFENDFTQLEKGDKFFIRILNEADGTQRVSVADPIRFPVIIVLVLVLLVVTTLYGGKQGLRGLATLVGSIFLIAYVLIPQIIGGADVLTVALIVSGVIVVFGSYVTHGFSRMTTSAVIGMLITLSLSGVLAYAATVFGKLSGYSSDESTALFFQFAGSIDLVGVLMAGMLIGLLGVLYDSAIGQAAAVAELYQAHSGEERAKVFAGALRIGREHIGALINTLALAYVGSALPLFLLLSGASAPLLYIVNGEVFATEIIRILVGSIGLVLSVPITTAVAVFLLKGHAAKAGTHSHHHG